MGARDVSRITAVTVLGKRLKLVWRKVSELNYPREERFALTEKCSRFEKLEKNNAGGTTSLHNLSRVSMSNVFDLMPGFGFFYGMALRQIQILLGHSNKSLVVLV